MAKKTTKRKALTPAQKAARSKAAKKAAATRKRNKAKKAREARVPKGIRLARARQLERARAKKARTRQPSDIETFGRSAVSRLRKGSALKRQLDTEEPAVRNFAKRAIRKGQTPLKAIQQGRVLHNAGRIDDKGRLKKSGGEKLSKSRLKKLLRI